MKIFIGTDHRGAEVEANLVTYLKGKGYDAILCPLEHSPSDDYVDFAFDVAKNVASNKESLGILICGTGIGMSIAANKVKGAYAARCATKEDASLAKEHNAANIICLGVNDNSFEQICQMVDIFITTKSADSERHLRRVNKVISYEAKAYNEL